MTSDIIATILTGVGVLIGVWRLVEGMRKELNSRIDTLDGRMNSRFDAVSNRMEARYDVISSRVDDVLLRRQNS